MKLGNSVIAGVRPDMLAAYKKGGAASLSLAQQINQSVLAKPQELSRKLAEQIHKNVLAKPQAQNQKTAEADRNRIEKERRQKQYERELRACRTKKDVEALRARWRTQMMAEMSAIGKSNMSADQKAEAMAKAAEKLAEKEEVAAEFMASSAYHTLPDEAKKEEQHKKASRDTTQSVQDKQDRKDAAETKQEPAEKGKTPETAVETVSAIMPESAPTTPVDQTQGGEGRVVTENTMPSHAAKGAQPEHESPEMPTRSGSKISVYA